MHGSQTDRAQSGLDRLLLFVLVVVAVLLVAPHALGFVGIDVTSTPRGPPTGAAAHDLVVLEARGIAVDEAEGSIGAVRLVVTPAANREPVDLGDQLVIWVDDRTAYLHPNDPGDGFDGTYRASLVDGEGTVLADATDRAELVFDLGDTDDVDGVDEFGRRLRAGDTVSLTIVTPHGETLTRELTVPETVAGDAVAL